jgi:NADPH:quinone reductase-like Zn-dependent oxidoreductase
LSPSLRQRNSLVPNQEFERLSKNEEPMFLNLLLRYEDLLEDGKIKPVIDACYPLSRTAEAFRYFGKGHARGKVVITIAAKE